MRDETEIPAKTASNITGYTDVISHTVHVTKCALRFLINRASAEKSPHFGARDPGPKLCMEAWRTALGLDQGKGTEVDPTAHIGSWSQTIGFVVLPLAFVAIVASQTCCKAASRSVNETDAPELEELTTVSGACVRQVDTVVNCAGKLVDVSRKTHKKSERSDAARTIAAVPFDIEQPQSSHRKQKPSRSKKTKG